jgi:hypothetical protein
MGYTHTAPEFATVNLAGYLDVFDRHFRMGATVGKLSGD